MSTDADKETLVLHLDNPGKCARLLIKRFYSKDGVRAICYYNGQFYIYNDGYYQALSDVEFDADLRSKLEKCYKPGKDTNFVPVVATNRLMGEIRNAMRAATVQSEHAPCYLKDTLPIDGYPAKDFVPMRNGLYHWQTKRLYPLTAAYFNTFTLSFDYSDADMATPEWDKFLNSCFPDDEASIKTIDEIIGYLLSGNRSLHKIFWFIGEPRAGKGTIAKIIQECFGAENCGTPSLNDFTAPFGLEELIGKPVAISSDVQLNKRANNALMYEYLLRISSEERIQINQKGKRYWAGTLPMGLLLISNEWPNLSDIPAALMGRLVIVHFKISYLGKEKTQLIHLLQAELPGIFQRVREAYDTLMERGRFLNPRSAESQMDALQAIKNPLLPFIKEACNVGPNERVKKVDLLECYEGWCDTHDKLKMSKQWFYRNLNDAVKVTLIQPRIDGVQLRENNALVGIGLKDASQYGEPTQIGGVQKCLRRNGTYS